jgi:glutamate/tyrosine decarboxylase-like PLP-dependent enzyme
VHCGTLAQAAGVLVSGGSAANLTALASAREARIGAMDEHAVVYMSDQTHSSLARAVRALGFRSDHVRIIPSDERARVRPDALRSAIAADQVGRRRPLVVVANAGTTAAGAVDSFHELAQICGENGVWLHVDDNRVHINLGIPSANVYRWRVFGRPLSRN